LKLSFKTSSQMNKELTHTKYQALEGFDCTQFQTNASFHLTSHKAIPHKGVAFLFENKQSITILLMLIISSIKQRVMIELAKTTESSSNDLTVLPGDLNNILKVVSGMGNLC